MTSSFDWIDLGQMAYEPALALQYDIHAEVLSGDRPPTVLLLEHEPTITISRRTSASEHLRATRSFLEEQGVAICQTDRGGDITYHGPGQLVVYPIVPLTAKQLNVRRYVKLLEEVVIQTIAHFGLQGHQDASAIGVWISGDQAHATEAAKIAAIGVRIRRWVSLHGIALNVTPDLTPFQWIVPCGLTRPVTSMAEALGDQCPAIETVKDCIKDVFQQRWHECD